MSNSDIVVAAIRASQGLTDSELVPRTGIKSHQQVNQICRRLAREGRILREIGPNGLLVERASPASVNSHLADQSTSPEAWHRHAPTATRASLSALEHLDRRETRHIRRTWPSVGVDEPSSTSARQVIEANTIALLSNARKPPIDPPSPGWLGHHADREAIRESGLWNVNHVCQAFNPAALDLLELRIRVTPNKPRLGTTS